MCFTVRRARGGIVGLDGRGGILKERNGPGRGVKRDLQRRARDDRQINTDALGEGLSPG